MQSLPVVVLRLIYEELDELDVVCLSITCTQLHKTLITWPCFTLINTQLTWTRRNKNIANITNTPVIKSTLSNSNNNIDTLSQSSNEIDNLPNSLLKLHLGPHFNRTIPPGSLPPSLTDLTLGTVFNQVVMPGTLPTSLRSLSFGFLFNQPIWPGSLPPFLTSLSFGYTFNQPLRSLPTTLVELKVGPNYHQLTSDVVLPASITTLSFPFSHQARYLMCVPATARVHTVRLLYPIAVHHKPLELHALNGLARLKTLVLGLEFDASKIDRQTDVINFKNAMEHLPNVETYIHMYQTPPSTVRSMCRRLDSNGNALMVFKRQVQPKPVIYVDELVDHLYFIRYEAIDTSGQSKKGVSLRRSLLGLFRSNK
ncbi:hypothetical protein SAMD00019534_044080 [Acytostelium subglobosum LB1]|uniref:hypothetical protein n=1 Tax=Acytostelium subglobosum LB1 TaxID=1410327 RepID=UPI000644DFB3|nr:hypothetical protein SAMD00019534_044080 [Acytostelium subglobosum LB1]GAM21233.1 hypothetical protein SAMD00019534_044080 [Acytostelium subglobosum LB1]|eukprot:XP_012755352.1 hypothetical protein SAMD00019534_044080 [Acytostelium subglobosum LB1]